MKLSEIAKLINASVVGNDDIEITGVAKIESASASEISFITGPAYIKYLTLSNAGAVIVPASINGSASSKASLLKVEDPYLSFIKLAEIFIPEKPLQETRIHESSVISKNVSYGENFSAGANTFIGEDTTTGNDVTILPGSVIMNDVIIGNNVLIHPNVIIYNGCRIGNNVIIHSGTVIGSDGFGHVKTKSGAYQKIPQKGIVVVSDDAEIGSNCTIDRATLGETLISKGVKLDNQIQIAHNVVIGENTVIAAQTGIAGSTKIGKNCMIGGKVGIVGHIEICDNVIIGGGSNVSKSITEPGTYAGYRAMPIKKELQREALLRKLLKK